MPSLTVPTQRFIGIGLALLMILTRGQHFASVDALPSASWAIFFLAGALLRPWAWFVILFALASALDVISLRTGTITQWCLSPAYWALVPAYGALWSAGRVYALLHRQNVSTLLPLSACLLAGATVAYLCSGGGFYFFSGRYPDATLAGFLPRIAEYLPKHLLNLGLYVGFAVAVYAVTAPSRAASTRIAHPSPP